MDQVQRGVQSRAAQLAVDSGFHSCLDLTGLAVCGVRHRRVRPAHCGLAREQRHAYRLRARCRGAGGSTRRAMVRSTGMVSASETYRTFANAGRCGGKRAGQSAPGCANPAHTRLPSARTGADAGPHFAGIGRVQFPRRRRVVRRRGAGFRLRPVLANVGCVSLQSPVIGFAFRISE